ncbi:class I SAM-dependent methyltransferase [Streptomyces hundungensis]|uniref:class I SAM-dependent methyltransferase n=1 Tax=Streptomyces hundungensis TaxID=1077946 RepID=UPI0033DA8D51
MTEAAHLTTTRESYDSIAAVYAERVVPPAELDPVSRAMLAAFAELVRGAGGRPVADVGCGPGRVTAHLTALGLSAFGVDLSPNMVRLASEAYPELRFREASMDALDVPDNALGGMLAWYSTHHTPPELLPAVFAEFHRTLGPGGFLLWGDYTGDTHLRPTHAFGQPVSYESYHLPLDRTIELLRQAGFLVTTRVEQEPNERVHRTHGCLLAHKADTF